MGEINGKAVQVDDKLDAVVSSYLQSKQSKRYFSRVVGTEIVQPEVLLAVSVVDGNVARAICWLGVKNSGTGSREKYGKQEYGPELG